MGLIGRCVASFGADVVLSLLAQMVHGHELLTLTYFFPTLWV